MKKSTLPASATGPLGIVITTGVRAPIDPLVRAYMWSPAPESNLESDTPSHSEKLETV